MPYQLPGGLSRLAAPGRQPRFPMFAESRLWKCEAFGANDSLRTSSRTHTIGHILTFGRSEADAGYDRSRGGADSGWCRKHWTEVPVADVQVTATPTDLGRGRQRQLVMAPNRRNRPVPVGRHFLID
jgi:hypothetical protein